MEKKLNGFTCLRKAISTRHCEGAQRLWQSSNEVWTATLPMVARSDEKRRAAFTLAETLIVIVVLGIIATLTIPALVNKNKESVAKTKVKKAMAAYESALNKMIIENDLKSDDTLAAWAGNAGNGCANSSNYFKKAQDVNGCIFKTSDGIWWDISNIERPLIAFNQDNLTPAKANAENDMSAFVLVGRFGNDGSLRVDDLAYETANSVDDANGYASKAQVEKLYGVLEVKISSEEDPYKKITIDGVNYYMAIVDVPEGYFNEENAKSQENCSTSTYSQCTTNGDYWNLAKRHCESNGGRLPTDTELFLFSDNKKLPNDDYAQYYSSSVYETDDGDGYTCVSFAFSGEIGDGDCVDKGYYEFDVQKVLCLRDN